MRVLIISDIHANLTALDAVIHEVGEVDNVWCLGDIVGYGPDPNECVDRVRELPDLVCLLGNHDAAVLGQINVDSFNPEAKFSIQWMQHNLSAENLAFLADLPTTYTNDHVTLAHGSPRSPVFEYILDNYLATENFAYFSTPFCFVGHTHLPAQFSMTDENVLAKLTIPRPNVEITLQPRTIINPGSVGQPRDRDPRAAYAIFDTETFTWDFRRVPYEIGDVQARMQEAGLPEKHIQRLVIGW